MDAIRKEFNERGLRKTYNKLNNDVFTPYFPSENIQREFRQIAENIDMDNPFEEARDVLLDIQDDLRDLSFDDEFDIDIENYLPSYDDMAQLAPTPTPSVNPSVVSNNQLASINAQGLTPTEQALLSPEEQAIRLKQRGMS